MALLTKPDMQQVWASGGDIVEPSDLKKQQGWTVEVPPHQFENWIQNRQDEYLAHINQRGIPQWDGGTEYEAGGLSYTQGSDGVIYKSVAASGPTTTVQDPTTDVADTYWTIAFANFSTPGSATFTTPGATPWIVPGGVTRVKVKVIGGGGGGGKRSGSASASAAGGGGGGGISEGFVDVTPGASITVTVGAAGVGATAVNTAGTNGGASSFGAFMSATGGLGGGTTGGGAGGTGTGGSFNSSTGPGQSGINFSNSAAADNGSSGAGGGAGGAGITFSSGSSSLAGNPATGPGGGGGGAVFAGNGGPGFAGFVEITW